MKIWEAVLVRSALALLLLAPLYSGSWAAEARRREPAKRIRAREKENVLVDAQLRSELSDLMEDGCDWILTYDVGGGSLKRGKYSRKSIWVSANFARALLAGYSMTGDRKYLEPAIKWCDYLVAKQQAVVSHKGNEVGYWLSNGSSGNIYFGDAGTAATALAVACRYVDDKKRKRYIEALERYAGFVMEGCEKDPSGEGRGNSPGWIIGVGKEAGALGCGYYKGHVSRLPYVTSTATTGGAFFAALYDLTGDERYKKIAVDAVKWILDLRKPSGEIPCIIDNQARDYWPYTIMTYCTEAIVGTYWVVKDREVRDLIRQRTKLHVQWLVKTQNEDGTWGKEKADMKRSPGVLTLLSWYHREVEQDEKVASAILLGFNSFLDEASGKTIGIMASTTSTGFAVLAIEELLQPGITFCARKGSK